MYRIKQRQNLLWSNILIRWHEKHGHWRHFKSVLHPEDQGLSHSLVNSEHLSWHPPSKDLGSRPCSLFTEWRQNQVLGDTCPQGQIWWTDSVNKCSTKHIERHKNHVIDESGNNFMTGFFKFHFSSSLFVILLIPDSVSIHVEEWQNAMHLEVLILINTAQSGKKINYTTISRWLTPITNLYLVFIAIKKIQVPLEMEIILPLAIGIIFNNQITINCI